MASKQFEIANLGTITVYKRRGSKSLRLSVNSDGKIRVTMPTWLPYQAGVAFAQQKAGWLHSQSQRETFKDGQRIGKYHTLRLVIRAQTTNTKTQLTKMEAIVYSSPQATPAQIQEAAHTVAKRATKAEGDQLLPQRLKDLAKQHSFQYKEVKIRHLKSRWGSCSSLHNITLNYYLMQLPWGLIDYVLIHELSHTRELNHSPEFWQYVEACIPDYKQKRRQLRDYQPSLLSQKP